MEDGDEEEDFYSWKDVESNDFNEQIMTVQRILCAAKNEKLQK